MIGLTPMTATVRRQLPVSLGEAGSLLVIALLVAGAGWALRGERLPWRAVEEFYAAELAAPLVSVAEARQYYDAGSHYFVDVRPGEPGGGIPGSFRVRQESFADDLYEQREFLYPEDPVILYGEGSLQVASAVAARLQDRGFADVLILQGGLPAWREAGHPADPEGEG